jgi:hypothetical protein
MRVLVCTFGFSIEKILAAMKHLPSPRLILVTSDENLQRPKYQELRGILKDLGQKVEIFKVDKFDFLSSLERITELLNDLLEERHEVVLNISGGVPLLSDAAILAAFHAGVPAYYVDDSNLMVRLPVLKGAKTEPRLTRGESKALLAIRDGMDFRDVDIGEGPWSDGVKTALQSLKKGGFLRTDGVLCYLTTSGQATADWIRRCEQPSG